MSLLGVQAEKRRVWSPEESQKFTEIVLLTIAILIVAGGFAGAIAFGKSQG